MPTPPQQNHFVCFQTTRK